jgi:ribosomal protein S18 acetylase RimI-like enzyme
VAAFETATASQPLLGRYAGSPYISVLALSERYRGRRKAGRRLGDFVLQDVLRAIDERWGGTPNVFALVNPTNSPSRNLFERNGFRMIVAAEPNNHESDALFRRGGQQVPSGRMPVEAMPTSRL